MMMSKTESEKKSARWDGAWPGGGKQYVAPDGFFMCSEWDSLKRKWKCEGGKENNKGRTEEEL